MKQRSWIARMILLLVAVFIMFLPRLSLVFVGTLIAAFPVWFFLDQTWALTYFFVGCWIYVGMALFMVPFLVTYNHVNCCVGFQTFMGHMRHEQWRTIALESLLWPLALRSIERHLGTFSLPFVVAVGQVVEYWTTTRRHGVELTFANMQTGTVTTRHVKDDEGLAAIANELHTARPPED